MRQAAQQLAERVSPSGVECGRGFVEQEERRIGRESACDGDALRFAAGELAWQRVATVRDAERIEKVARGIAPTLTIRPGFPVRVIVTRDLILECSASFSGCSRNQARPLARSRRARPALRSRRWTPNCARWAFRPTSKA